MNDDSKKGNELHVKKRKIHRLMEIIEIIQVIGLVIIAFIIMPFCGKWPDGSEEETHE